MNDSLPSTPPAGPSAGPPTSPPAVSSADGAGGPARHRLYGLRVESSAPLPALPHSADGGEPDVRVLLGGHFATPAPATEAGWRRLHVSPRSNAGDEPTVTAEGSADGAWLRLRYADGTEFTVDAGGTRVGCTWAAPMTLEDTATYLLGPVFGIVLRLRGLSCLHASAVEVGDRALLLCGPAGAGKSTTAAAFAARGHGVMGDDVAALEEGESGTRVRPAYPQLRLWPSAVHALYGAGARLPPLTPNWEKRYLDLSGGGAFQAEPRPLGAVYLLATREEAGAPRLEPLSHGGAVMALVSNTYSGWLPNLGAQARDLALFARLARRVPVVRAVPHEDPARLGELCAIIERHFAAAGKGTDG